MLPSRSSNRAVTAVPAEGVLPTTEEMPLLLNLRRPRVVPTQMFASRSRIIDRTSACCREDGTPIREGSVPFQRHTPLLVPIHNSYCSSGRRQLILVFVNTLAAAEK